jgi:hypothetical protein
MGKSYPLLAKCPYGVNLRSYMMNRVTGIGGIFFKSDNP